VARGRLTLRRRESFAGVLFVLPALAVVVGVCLFPVLYNVWMSFFGVTLENLGKHPPFAGFANYIRIARDRDFLSALGLTCFYSITSSFFAVALGLVAALALASPFRGRNLCRTLFLFPYIAPVVAVTFVWRWIFAAHGGAVANWTLMNAGLISEPVSWLSERPFALATVILFQAWRYFPFAMLLIIARLQAIPKELYEAAAIDGAGAPARFLFITLPELKPILGVLFLLRVVWTFNKFDDIFLLTGGAAGTKVLPILTYEYAFKLHRIGQGAACAMYLLAILAVLIIVYQKTVLKWED